ncbi:hypothetical protein TNCV_540511 [Trichonephila clavipes]|nr:hypothetical protein TNCV_540511 [Trichonephila clavipes]
MIPFGQLLLQSATVCSGGDWSSARVWVYELAPRFDTHSRNNTLTASWIRFRTLSLPRSSSGFCYNRLLLLGGGGPPDKGYGALVGHALSVANIAEG